MMSNTKRFKPESSPSAHVSSPSNGEKQCQSRPNKKLRTTDSMVDHLAIVATTFRPDTPVSGRQGRSPSIPQTSSSTKSRREHKEGRQSLLPSVLEAMPYEPPRGPPSPVSSPARRLKPPPAPKRPEAVQQRQLSSAKHNRHDAARDNSTTTARQAEYKKGRSKVGGLGVQEESARGRIVHSEPLSPSIRKERYIHGPTSATNHSREERLSSSKVVRAATTTDHAETKVHAPRNAFKAGRTTDHGCNAQAEAGEVVVFQRRNTPRKARSSTEAKWTEVVVPAQVLHDEIRAYQDALKKAGKRVAPEVDRALDMWHENVARRLVQQNQLALQNIEAVHQENLVKRLVDTKRGELHNAGTDVRRLKEEVRQLKSKVEERKAWNADRQVASRFLHALDRLRR